MALSHYSNIPVFQYRIITLSHYSIIPLSHYRIIALSYLIIKSNTLLSLAAKKFKKCPIRNYLT